MEAMPKLSQEEILQAIANLSRPQTGLEKANLLDLWAELDYRLHHDGSIIARLQAENERLKRDVELLEQMRESLLKMSSEDKKTIDKLKKKLKEGK